GFFSCYYSCGSHLAILLRVKDYGLVSRLEDDAVKFERKICGSRVNKLEWRAGRRIGEYRHPSRHAVQVGGGLHHIVWTAVSGNRQGKTTCDHGRAGQNRYYRLTDGDDLGLGGAH